MGSLSLLMTTYSIFLQSIGRPLFLLFITTLSKLYFRYTYWSRPDSYARCVVDTSANCRCSSSGQSYDHNCRFSWQECLTVSFGNLMQSNLSSLLSHPRLRHCHPKSQNILQTERNGYIFLKHNLRKKKRKKEAVKTSSLWG